MHTIPSLGHAEAQKAIEVIQAELLKRGLAAVITVADSHGELIALLRLDGAPLPSIQIASNKARTAASASPRVRLAKKSATHSRVSILPITATRKWSDGAADSQWWWKASWSARSESAGCRRKWIWNWPNWGSRQSRP